MTSNTAKCPYVYVVGKPAVGKTTVAQFLLGSLGIGPMQYVQMDAAHRALCPPEGRSRRYHYSREGQLVLDDRDRLMREALEWMGRRTGEIARCSLRVPVVLIELCYPDYAYALSVVGGPGRDCMVIDVRSDHSAVVSRNNARSPAERVPADFIAATEMMSDFSGGGRWTLGLHVVRNGAERSLDELKREVHSIATSLVQALGHCS